MFGGFLSVHVGRQQTLGNQVVLPHTQGTERHRALENFAGARIGDRTAGAPSAGRPVHPVDHVVADVVAAHVLGAQLHAECVDEARRLERLVPPAGAVQQRGADRFRGAGIEVVDDRLDRFAHCGARVAFLQAVTADEALRHRFAQRHRVILEGHASVSGTGIVGAGRVFPQLRELYQRMVHADRGRRRGRRHAAHTLEGASTAESPEPPAPTRLPHEGQRRFHLRVLGEVHHHRHVDRAAARIQPVGSGTHPPREPGDVLHEERGEVHQDAVTGRGRDSEAPQRRRREGILHRLALGGVVAGRAEAVVRLDHEHLRADPVEAHHPRPGLLSPVDADVVGTQARADSRGVEHVGVPEADLEPDPAGRLLPVDGEEAVHALHGGGLLLDGWGSGGVAGPVLCDQREWRDDGGHRGGQGKGRCRDGRRAGNGDCRGRDMGGHTAGRADGVAADHGDSPRFGWWGSKARTASATRSISSIVL